MAQHSAGIFLWRRRGQQVEVLLAHFGGPYWAKKQAGAWAVPKGLIEPGESAEDAARREFQEELGVEAPAILVPLGEVRQAGGKRVTAFAVEGELDCSAIVSGTFTMEWPPRSGKFASYPEVDQARWFTLKEARAMILPSQRPLIEMLERHLAGD